MPKAKLIAGQSYWVQGFKFETGKEVTVTAEVAEYLKTLKSFEVTEEQKAPAEEQEAPAEEKKETAKTKRTKKTAKAEDTQEEGE
jgi:F0F1-type ATP synthase epsilon subunit